MADFKGLPKRAAKNLGLLTLIIGFIASYSAIFKSENSLIGVGIITAILFFKDIDLGVKRRHGSLLVCALLILSVLVPYLAHFNIFLGFAINLSAIYYITILTSEKIEYKAYIGFILLYVLSEGNPVQGEAMALRLLSVVLFGVIIMVIYFVKHKNDTEYKNLIDVKQDAHIENISFALKLAFSLSFAMFLAGFFQVYKHMWFTITVMSLTQIDVKVTFDRMKHRVLYTLLGSIIYIVIFGMILPSHLLIYITLTMSYIYTFIKRYDIQMIFITINSLIANEIFFSSNKETVFFRIALMLSGVLFSYVITKINFGEIYKRIKGIRKVGK